MEDITPLYDIECEYCMMTLGVAQDYVNLAWCSNECYRDWKEAQEEE